MKEYEFRYFDSSIVKIGDWVLGPYRQSGRVTEIIQPGSLESEGYSCSEEGGVLFVFDTKGVPDPVLMLPPDGESWEDIEFIKRGAEN